MKKFLPLIALLLAACESTPIAIERHFPDATPVLMEKCPQLYTIQGEKVSIVDMLKTVVENYKLYYACNNKVEGWQEWYTEQKQIFDSVNE